MSTDLYSTVLYNDGEGLETADLNNSQRFASARLHDSLIQYLAQANDEVTISPSDFQVDPEFNQSGVDINARWAYALAPGQAFLKIGSANHKIAIAPGTLLQKIGASDGVDATLLSFTFTGADAFTLTGGDATNPRVDLLQMKLEYVDGGSEARDFEDAMTRAITSTALNKRRRVQCTLSVKAGTPATSPVYPNPDTGYVPVGAVVVGNGWNTGGNAIKIGDDVSAASNAVLHDLRMPLRVRAYRVDPSMYKLVTAWALSNSNSTVTSSNATNDLYVPCPAGLGRLVGVSIHVASGGMPTPFGTAAKLGQSTGIITSSFVARNFAPLQTDLADVIIPRAVFEASHASSGGGPGVGPNIVASDRGVGFDNVGYGPPLWTNGRRALNERHRLSTGTTAPDRLVLRLQSGVNANVIGEVVFFIAGGM